jgi:threonine/homoserine/homoserine lactone efflux protein
LFGFAFILSQNQKVYTLFKYGAAAYLLYLAFMSLRAKAPTDTILQNQENNSALPSFFQAFKVGFITNAFNPKASLFFLSVYTAIIHPQTPILIQTGYGVYMAIATALWFSLVSVLFGNQSLRSAFFSHSHWVERLIGLVLIALAVGLILP